MLTAVWVAIVVAVAFWVIGVCVAVFVMMKAARAISETADAVSSLRQRGDAVIDRANAAVDSTHEQLLRTGAITASLDEVTANMAELSGKIAALAPLARLIGGSASSPVARTAALAYGVRRALRERRGGRGVAGGGMPAPASRALVSPVDRGRRRSALPGGREEGP